MVQKALEPVQVQLERDARSVIEDVAVPSDGVHLGFVPRRVIRDDFQSLLQKLPRLLLVLFTQKLAYVVVVRHRLPVDEGWKYVLLFLVRDDGDCTAQ